MIKEKGDGIIISYDLMKINDHKANFFYKVWGLEKFTKLLKTESAMEIRKANNCKDIFYKLKLVD